LHAATNVAYDFCVKTNTTLANASQCGHISMTCTLMNLTEWRRSDLVTIIVLLANDSAKVVGGFFNLQMPLY
jgi:hypothetical protein